VELTKERAGVVVKGEAGVAGEEVSGGIYELLSRRRLWAAEKVCSRCAAFNAGIVGDLRIGGLALAKLREALKRIVDACPFRT
jgi:hypothetical protein